MTRAEAVFSTLHTPGWEEIRKMMEHRIEIAKLAALVNTDEARVMEMWRQAQVADQLFRGLMRDIEQLVEEPEQSKPGIGLEEFQNA